MSYLHQCIFACTPQINYLLPNHPLESLNSVIIDILKLIDVLNEIVNEIYEYRNNNLILLDVSIVMPCGKKVDDAEHWNLRILKEKYEQIITPCGASCDKANIYNEIAVCKPIQVLYQRIHSKQDNTSGTLTPTMTFAEMKAAFNAEQ